MSEHCEGCNVHRICPGLSTDPTEVARLRKLCANQDHEICQILGKALGYPWFKDDQKNFPGATEADGVCVGEHVAETIAAEAAGRIAKCGDVAGWLREQADADHDVPAPSRIRELASAFEREFGRQQGPCKHARGQLAAVVNLDDEMILVCLDCMAVTQRHYCEAEAKGGGDGE